MVHLFKAHTCLFCLYFSSNNARLSNIFLLPPLCFFYSFSQHPVPRRATQIRGIQGSNSPSSPHILRCGLSIPSAAENQIREVQEEPFTSHILLFAAQGGSPKGSAAFLFGESCRLKAALKSNTNGRGKASGRKADA